MTISDGLLGDVDPNSFLDAGHELVCHSEIPAKGEIEVVYRIEAIWDKGTAALVELSAEGSLGGHHEPLFTSTGTTAPAPGVLGEGQSGEGRAVRASRVRVVAVEAAD